MKLTAVILLTACLQVAATGNAQKVSLDMQNVSLEKVFKEIKKQTGFYFLYNNGELRKVGKVSVHVNNATVDEAISQSLLSTGFTFRIVDKTIVLNPKEPEVILNDEIPVPPPAIDIRGRVVNENGEPVEGVTVSVKGTKIATATNANGEFSLTGIDRNSTLVFSGVNVELYEIKVNNKTDLGLLTLKTKVIEGSDVTLLVSTGYQTISRERAAGSFDVVGRDILDKRPVSNISTALQGVVAGLQAKENLDGSMEFLIRGTSSLYAGKSPLVVVDGFPIVGTDFSNLNPNDVETVTVLKDAAAASIWGARAANGVIVITTKRPKAGRDKMTVEVNAFTRISKMIDLDQVMSQANTSDFIKYEKLAYDRELFFTTPYSPSFSNIGKSLTLAEELMFANRNGLISAGQMNQGLDSLSKISNRKQVEDMLLRPGILNQLSVTLSSATDRTKTYGSLLYENKKDGFIKKGYERYLMNFNNQFQATKSLQLTFGANVQYRKTETSGTDVGEIQSLSPYETLLNPDGKYSVNLNSWNRAEQALLPLSKFPYADWTYNLLREVRGRERESEQLSIRVQAGINFKIIKGLDFDSKVQYERIKNDNSDYQSEETFYVRNLVNTYVDYNNTTKVVGIKYLPNGGILKTNNSLQESYVVRNQLNFNRVIRSKFNVTAIAGTEISRYLTTSTTDPWVYGYFPEKNQSTVPIYGYGSSSDLFKTFTATTANATLSGGNTTFGWGVDKYVSFYGNAGVTYNSKYVLTGSVRSDASNYITSDPKLRWAPLWSVGGMWHISREDFMKGISAIDMMSVRLTYGKNGNTEKSTSTLPLVSVGTSPNTSTGTFTATVSNNGNPYLRWEKTATTNFGIDFSLFKNKIFGKLDLYNKMGKDITGTVLLPAVTGSTSQRFNNAAINNKGIEVELGANFDITNKIKYSTSLTYAYNRNEIKSLYFPSYLAFQLVDPNTAFVQGRSIGAIYSYTFLGVTDSVPYVAGPKGVPYSMNAVQLHNTGLGLDFLNYEGTNIPPHTLGWVSNFDAYGFNLMFVIVGKFGGVYRNPVFNFPTYVGSNKTNVGSFVSNVFAGDANIPQFPKYREPQFYLWDRYTPNLEGLVESSSFIECKEINLQYTLPQRISKKLQMTNLRVFAQVRDLGMIWHANKQGYNPEWLPGTQRPVTAFTFGINSKF